jgi:hypothetical protein
MKNLLSRSVTLGFWLFVAWQVAGVLILLNNFDLVLEVYNFTLAEIQQRGGK